MTDRQRILEIKAGTKKGFKWGQYFTSDIDDLCDLALKGLEAEKMRHLLANLEGSITDIIEDTDGLAGFHLNGDLAAWGEFCTLNNRIDDARAALQSAGEDE